MEPKEFDFEFPRGDTPPLSFELKDSNGNILDATSENCELIFTARDASKNIKIQKKLSTGEITIDNGTAQMFFRHNDTKDLRINETLNYDVQLTSGDYYATIIIGKIKLTNEVTY